MKILSLIWELRFIIIWFLLAVVSCIAAGKQWLHNKAYSLMLLAKKLAKDQILNSGKEQEDWATDALYSIIRKFKIPFITKEAVRKIVVDLYIKALNYLEDGSINKVG